MEAYRPCRVSTVSGLTCDVGGASGVARRCGVCTGQRCIAWHGSLCVAHHHLHARCAVVGEIDGRLYVGMPLIDGVDLGALLARDGALPVGRSVAIVEQAADALDVAQVAGLIHRDVKPSNILVAARDFTYLIDFGIARAVDGTKLSLSGAVIGTPAYLAPERFDGVGDHRGDIYALVACCTRCSPGASHARRRARRRS
ncbi:MAG: serine/threonine-protein kinase [Pseudonocardia sp.]